MAEEISTTGVFVDSKTGQVVNSKPEEGVQLVAPGGLLDADARARIEREKNPETATTMVKTAEAPAAPAAAPAKTVTTETAQGK